MWFDTCIHILELSKIKDFVQNAIALLPEDALIWIITFGKHIFVHELRSLGVHKTFVFKGDKPRTSSRIQKAFNIDNFNDPKASKFSQNLIKFLALVVDY